LARLGKRPGHRCAAVEKGTLIVHVPPDELGAYQFGEKAGARLARILYGTEAAFLEAAGKDGTLRPAKGLRPSAPAEREAAPVIRDGAA
jgi:hypothetical protein